MLRRNVENLLPQGAFHANGLNGPVDYVPAWGKPAVVLPETLYEALVPCGHTRRATERQTRTKSRRRDCHDIRFDDPGSQEHRIGPDGAEEEQDHSDPAADARHERVCAAAASVSFFF